MKKDTKNENLMAIILLIAESGKRFDASLSESMMDRLMMAKDGEDLDWTLENLIKPYTKMIQTKENKLDEIKSEPPLKQSEIQYVKYLANSVNKSVMFITKGSVSIEIKEGGQRMVSKEQDKKY